MNYRADIDGLRAVAVLLVLVFHFKLVPFGDAGFVGVDVFFVISGFLITTIISKEADIGTFSFSRFYIRRIRRLHPPLIVVLSFFLISAAAIALPSQSSELSMETIASLTYSSNIYFWRTVNYFGLQAEGAPLLHTWSLAVEEQFYILFPAVFLFFYRRFALGALPVVVIAAVASFALNIVMVEIKPAATFYLLPTRAWEMLIGAALALYALKRPEVMVRCGPLGLPGAALIAASLLIFDRSVQAPGWFAALPTLGAAMLIAAGFNTHSLSARVLGWGPAVWVGRISYSLYLVHWPIMIVTAWCVAEVGLALNFLGFVLSFIAAAAIYAAVETPVRMRRALGSTRALLMFFGCSSAALIGVAAIVAFSGGFPGRFGPEVHRILAYAEDDADDYLKCDVLSPSWTGVCVIGDLSVEPDALLMGDSHAFAEAGAFHLWLKREGRSAIFAFHYGCLPTLGAGRQSCNEYSERMISLAEATRSIHDVIIVSIWRQSFQGSVLFDGVWRRGAATQSYFVRSLDRTLDRLVGAGKHVTLVEPLYAAPNSVPNAMARNIAFGQDWPVDTDLAVHKATFAQLYAAFDQTGRSGVRRLSLIDRLCEGGVCRGVWNKLPVFFDSDHIRFGMSAFLSDEIEKGMAEYDD